MYERKEIPPPVVGAWCGEIAPRRALDSPTPVDPAQRDRARRAYYAQITFIDHQINRLTHALWAHGCLENTCVLFCADHGEMLYDHNLLAKATAYEGSARVPFLLRFPLSWGYSSGAIVDAPVELRDVLPTLCEIAGVPVPGSIEGRSLLPFCKGESLAWREHIHGEHALGARSNHWLTDGRKKYVWHSQTGVEQLFDLLEDPRELHDVAADRPAEIEGWRERLVQELAGREEGYVEDGRLVVGRRPQATLAEVGLPPLE
jgi:arylsulfatase A-like enzyme